MCVCSILHVLQNVLFVIVVMLFVFLNVRQCLVSAVGMSLCSKVGRLDYLNFVQM